MQTRSKLHCQSLIRYLFEVIILFSYHLLPMHDHPINCLQDFFDDYKCDCIPGYMGRDCELEINECSPNPCINGNCTDFFNNYTCQCFDKFRVSDRLRTISLLVLQTSAPELQNFNQHRLNTCMGWERANSSCYLMMVRYMQQYPQPIASISLILKILGLVTRLVHIVILYTLIVTVGQKL